MSRPTLPTGIFDNALVGYLNVATLCTVDIDGYKRFYGDAMKMQIEGPITLNENEKNVLKKRWLIPSGIDFDIYHGYRSAVESLINLRIIHLKQVTPKIHNSYSSYELGTFSLGFPTSDLKKMTSVLNNYSIQAMSPMQEGVIIRDNGEEAKYLETIFKGPDFLHCVGIERIAQPQLAPCDPETGFGGPGYSAIVVKDGDAEIGFYTEVLGHNLFVDAVWESSEGSALGIEPGVSFRFITLYAPGAKQNHILMLEYEKGKEIETDVPSHIPYQGLAMYTFQTSDLGMVLDKAVQYNIEILTPIQEVSDPILGNGTSSLLQSPNGFYIELFEKNKSV